jgi:hypothetical protein
MWGSSFVPGGGDYRPLEYINSPFTAIMAVLFPQHVHITITTNLTVP